MGKKIINIIKMIKNDKRFKYTLIVTIMLLFISIIGYSLSFFNNNNSTLVANIKVNDLVFNITTNSGESDDRILRLQAGKTESFTSTITNLNKIGTKCELIYDVCSDSNCTSIVNSLPTNTKIEYINNDYDEIIDNINPNESKRITLLTTNENKNDIYIRLNINAGYGWNDLKLANQITPYSKSTEIISYVDGIETTEYPDLCDYAAKLKGYKNNKEVELTNTRISCNKNTKQWTTMYTGNVDKIIIYFTKLTYSTFAEDTWETIAGVVRSGHSNVYPVGAEKKVEIGEKSYTVRVVNNTTSVDCENENFSQSACGFVVEFVDIIEQRVMNSSGKNIGGWPATDMRKYANGDFFNKLPSDLQNAITDTKVISGHGSTSGEADFTSIDKIYLLSSPEIGDTGPDTASSKTRLLDYYKGKNNNSRIKDSYWWLRNAWSSYDYIFIYISSSGGWADFSANVSAGFSPEFRIG